MPLVLSLLPSFSTLLFLVYLDTYKLVPPKRIISVSLLGITSALAALIINTFLYTYVRDMQIFTILISPFVEEFLKVMIVILLLYKNKTGFLTDSLILGFTIGFGFSMVENIWYIINYSFSNPFVWLLRGTGTAFLHSGTVMIFIILNYCWKNRNFFTRFLFPFLVMVFLHMTFNLPQISVLLKVALQLIFLPVVVIYLYNKGEKAIRKWIEDDFSKDFEILEMIKKGVFLESNKGLYLKSLTSHFSRLDLVDLYCYLSLTIELSISIKGMMIQKELDLKQELTPETTSKFQELKTLENKLGKITLMALKPLIPDLKRKNWQLLQLRT